MSACSGCAGDYEDPERTAPRGAGELNYNEDLSEEEEGGEADNEEGGEREEFPAEEE